MLRKRVSETIATIRQMRRERPTRFYELGELLLTLRDPAIWHLWRERTFRDFLNERVMPYSTALRTIVIVELPRQLAESLGHERAYQLARLARLDPDIESASELWERNPETEKRARTIRKASTRAFRPRHRSRGEAP